MMKSGSFNTLVEVVESEVEDIFLLKNLEEECSEQEVYIQKLKKEIKAARSKLCRGFPKMNEVLAYRKVNNLEFLLFVSEHSSVLVN